MAVLHTIKAWLYENLLTEDQNDYAARVSSEQDPLGQGHLRVGGGAGRRGH